MNAQLCRDLGRDLPVQRTHPPPHLYCVSLAIPTHEIAPSRPLVGKVVRMERRQFPNGGATGNAEKLKVLNVQYT
jgi:hypothetical protein